MWWGWSSHRGSSRGFGWSWGFIILGILLFTGAGRGMSWVIWPVLFCFVIPFVMRFFNSTHTTDDSHEKRKRYDEDVIIVDKAKRAPQYMVGDDGELVEVYDDELNQRKRKRSENDELEYF